MRPQSNKTSDRQPEGSTGKRLGVLLADVVRLHDELIRNLTSGVDQASTRRIERCANRYARAVSRYRTAIMELMPERYAAQALGALSSRPRCLDRRWRDASV